ncbi:Uncharacterised protein [Bacteroides intestinalis]|uniref:Uncharacterized protein n=1 Tax=Bacteroides intestinalis TaxID=329854 RepID=A0A6N2U686_9BACE
MIIFIVMSFYILHFKTCLYFFKLKQNNVIAYKIGH